MKIGLLHLLSSFLISLYWEKQQWSEIAWKAINYLQNMLLCFPRWTVICICQISLVSLSANWLNVVGLLHNRVIDSVVIPVTNIIKCTWHDVHLCNHFSKFSCMQHSVFFYSIPSINNNKFHQPFMYSSILFIFFPNQLNIFHP